MYCMYICMYEIFILKYKLNVCDIEDEHFTNAVSVSRENPNALSSVYIPNADGVVLTCGGDVAVRQQNDAEDAGSVTDECL